MGYLPSDDLGIEIEMFQDFSLMGQQRDSSRVLRDILREFGIVPGSKVGCCGWKTPSARLIGSGPEPIEIPSYLVDLCRNLTGDPGRVVNANALLMDNGSGLRAINEPEQIAFFEYASTVASDSILRFVRKLKPGMSEIDASSALDARGLPLSCHTMTSFGEKVRRGLSSPGNDVARLGDPFTAAIGVVGSLSCRAGFVASSRDDLSTDVREFYEAYIRNYFSVVVAWYENIRIGVTGGDVFAATERQRDPDLFHFAVNTGHLIHLDEWLNSPFSSGDRTPLRSGMAIQADIIPISNGPFCFANMEDGIVLADSGLRTELTERYPAMWERIMARRHFMTGRIGIRLDESVLPLSNIPAWMPPFALDLGTILVKG